jgi:glycosyltransferase involved in cell wall biosynthesis
MEKPIIATDIAGCRGLVDKVRARVIRGSGVDLEKFKGRGTRDAGRDNRDIERGTQDTKVKILFASRLLREKGIFELVEAFSVIHAKHPKTELLIAGDLYLENPSSLSLQEIEKLKKVNGCTFLGHVDDMQSLLEDCDIVVLPSYREGTPRILIEAAAMEKPIIATDIAGCRGLVVDGENGLLVPVKSVRPLVEAMEKLIVDADLRERFGRRGREIVLAEFDERIVLEKTLGVYEELYKPGTRYAGRGTRES